MPTVVTLSTDFENNDFVAGAMKGQILSLNQELNIVDISHELSSNNYAYTSYICKQAFKYFPENTIHIVLVDIFSAAPQHLLIAEYNKQYLITPDNGIMTMIMQTKPEQIAKFPLKENSHTTLAITKHAALIANELAKGKYIRQIGEEVETIKETYPMRAGIGEDWIEGQIIFIDKNQNAVVNITKQEFEETRKKRAFTIQMPKNDKIMRISDNYAGVQRGNLLAWFNSADYLEIALNSGRMAQYFGLHDISVAQAKHNKLYETIRIFFTNEDKVI